MPPLNIRDVGGIQVITFDDPASLNDGQATVYRQSIYTFLSEHPGSKFAADMKVVDFLASSGVALLIGLKRRADSEGSKFVLFHLHPYVQDLLRIMKLSKFFEVAEDEAGAVALLQSAPAS